MIFTEKIKRYTRKIYHTGRKYSQTGGKFWLTSREINWRTSGILYLLSCIVRAGSTAPQTRVLFHKRIEMFLASLWNRTQDISVEQLVIQEEYLHRRVSYTHKKYPEHERMSLTYRRWAGKTSYVHLAPEYEYRYKHLMKAYKNQFKTCMFNGLKYI